MDRTRAKKPPCNHAQEDRDRDVPLDLDGWDCDPRWESSKEVPAGVELFEQGSYPREIYLVEHGLAKLIRVTEEGQETIVGLRSSGWVLGANSAILGKPYPVTAVTLTQCRLRYIYADQFIRLARSDMEFSWYLHVLHTQELHDRLAHLVGLRCLTARQRFEQLLLQLVSSIRTEGSREEVRFKLPMRHWEAAQLVGITPEHLCRVQRQMEQEGLLQKENGWLIISDLDRLFRCEEF
jgi:CRP/FNR family transcriptional regulator